VSAPAPIELDLPCARVAFSTRTGGVSEGPYRSLNLGILTDDNRGRVEENRDRLARAVGLAPAAIVQGRQVHGTELAEWPRGPTIDGGGRCRLEPGRLPSVDGHLTDAPGIGLLVLVADCLPVALAGLGRAAMVHCGWRGLAGGIVEAAVARFDAPPAAAIGPGIGRCCYEVGDEVLAALGNDDGVAEGRCLDLRAVARRRLEACGVSRIEDVDECTSCRPDLFFSHRRDCGVTGRQGGLVWLT
jgi:purine-nucleoside/S-methyl-5'-thioadenosine phosphorylase / adenosine deaminase